MTLRIFITIILTFIIIGCGNSDNKKENSKSNDRNSPLNEEVDEVERLQKKFDKLEKKLNN